MATYKKDRQTKYDDMLRLIMEDDNYAEEVIRKSGCDIESINKKNEDFCKKIVYKQVNRISCSFASYSKSMMLAYPVMLVTGEEEVRQLLFIDNNLNKKQCVFSIDKNDKGVSDAMAEMNERDIVLN